jgi:hypothetical protein
VSAGTPEAQTTGADNGSAAPVTTDPFSGLSEDTRSWVETKGYKSPEDLATAYKSLEQKFGGAVTVPKEDAPKEDWDKFYSKLPEAMRPPESADKYEFKRPEGLPEDLPYSDELATTSKNWMHEAGLNTKQAQAIHDKFAGYMAEQQTAALQAQAAAVESTHADLTKEWGPVDSEGFKAKQALMDRAAKNLGLADSLKRGGLVLPDGSITDPQLAKALAAVGDSMFREDTIGNDPVAVASNPFVKDAKGSLNPTAISTLVKNDPSRAARLCREAGQKPSDWGIPA